MFFTLDAGGIEATLRFVAIAHHDRETKVAVTRRMLQDFTARNIRIGK